MKVLVIGDSCTDIFIYGDIDRICPEAPVPVIKTTHRTKNRGMAENVVANLEALGCEVDIITNPNDIKKIRYIDNRSNQLVLRVDEHDYCDKISNKELTKIREKSNEYDAVIISDYCKGFLTEEDIDFLIHNNHTVFLDTKKILGEWMYDVNFVKINEKEYEKTKRYVDDKKLNDKLIITRGSDGCQYQDNIYSVPQVDGVKDYSGAGDTFLSGFAYQYMDTKNVKSAINYAQECATIVVQKHGVATI